MYAGTAAGPAVVLKAKEICAEETSHVLADSQEEAVRFGRAEETTVVWLEKIYEKTRAELGEKEAELFHSYQMMIQDESFHDAVLDRILSGQLCAEDAVRETGRQFAAVIASVEDAYLRERAVDVANAAKHLLDALAGELEKAPVITEPSVIVADHLTPGELMNIERKNMLALVLTEESAYSHTVMLACRRKIPVIVEVSLEWKEIQEGMTVLVDGLQGAVYLEPSEEIVRAML